MDYQEYLKRILNEEEIKALNDCYYKDSRGGLRTNLIKTSPEHLDSIFNFKTQHPYVSEAFTFNKSEHKFGKDPLHYAGAYYLQEPSAMMVAHLLNVRKGDKVLDLCAAPGGKSSQVLSHLGDGVLVSNDISYKRAETLSENIERMGAINVYVLNEDAKTIEDKFYGYFDKVILDAPCSGQGMFRKNKEVMDDWTYNKVLSLSQTNKELIMRAYNCLKKDGVLVYSTCTFTTEENEDVINYLLDNTNASVEKIHDDDTFYKSSVDGAIRLYPFKFDGEGHFICLIRCNDEHETKKLGVNKEASSNNVKLYREFEKEYLNIHLDGKFIMMGDDIHYLKEDYFSLDRLKVLRNGLHLGKIVKDRFEPSHSLALYLKMDEAKYVANYDHKDKRIISYLKGNTLPSEHHKGYTLICVNDISLGWGKDDLRIIKNLYPKGLRML